MKTLTTWMDEVEAWSREYNMPIYYGEFGITNTQTAENGRDKWFQAHRENIKSRGWGASVWSDGGQHLVFDYKNETWVQDILDDLGLNNVSSSF